MGETNRSRILGTLQDLGALPYAALAETCGVPSGSFGRTLRELLRDGEIERCGDREYQLPRAEAQTRHYCALCGGSHVKGPGGWACTAEAS